MLIIAPPPQQGGPLLGLFLKFGAQDFEPTTQNHLNALKNCWIFVGIKIRLQNLFSVFVHKLGNYSFTPN